MQVPIQTHDDEPDLDLIQKANALFAQIEQARSEFESNTDAAIEKAKEDITYLDQSVTKMNKILEETAETMEKEALEFLEREETETE